MAIAPEPLFGASNPVAIRTSNGAVIGPFRTLLHLGAVGSMTDGQLLDRFANGRGTAAEHAFDALVERHGSMVLGVCRSVLRDEHDAQDAFQATFLVLVRKARSLWVRDSMAPWLHAVALRAARSARSARRRRTEHERQRAEMSTDRSGDAVDPDRDQLLHNEIDRLPERYRLPIVLCDLEGRTHEQASRHLGCPVGTVKSRLNRGRARLRERLARRGLDPAADSGSMLVAFSMRSPVPAELARATSGLASQIAAGRSAAGLASAAVAALTQEVSNAMRLAKLGTITAPALAVSLAAGMGVFAWGDDPSPVGPEAPPRTAPDDPRGTGDERDALSFHEVRAGELTPIVAQRGTLESERIERVTNPIEGATTVVSIVPEGTKVEAGQIVCVLDAAGLRERLQFQRLAIERAIAEASRAEHDLTVAEEEVKEYLEEVYPKEVETLEAGIALATEELAFAREDREGLRGASPDDPGVRRAGLAVRRSEFELTQAEQDLEILREYTRLKHIRQTDAARARRTEAVAAVEAERARDRELRQQIDQCEIVAPVAGRVAPPGSRGGPGLDAGSGVRERQILFDIIDFSSPMLVDIKVPESLIERIAQGQRARVRVDAFPGQLLPGVVEIVRPLPDPTSFFRNTNKVYTVKVRLDQAHPDLRPGLTADAEIIVVDPDDVLSVPARAVLHHGDTDYVAVKNHDGTFDWRAVRLGIRRDGLVEVTDGLRTGEVVAVGPLGLKVSGTPRDLSDRDDAEQGSW